MIPAIIILSIALAAAIITIGALVFRITNLELSETEQRNKVCEYRERNGQILREKAEIEELYKMAISDVTEEALKAAALSAELDELRSAAAETQQEEPETLPQRSKITWTLDRLPEGKTNTFRCMDYRKITDKTSDQYILQSEDFTFSDTDTGLRFSIIDGEKYYHAALATAYGIDIGNTWHVTLDTGYELNIIHAEYKHAIDNPRADDFGDPDVNYAGDKTTSVIEFVYDWEAAPQEIIDLGGMFIEDFGGKDGVLGNIIEMKPTGRKWMR